MDTGDTLELGTKSLCAFKAQHTCGMNTFESRVAARLIPPLPA